MVKPTKIPAINIAPFLAGEVHGKQQVAEAFSRACEDVGFVVISGHGIPQATIDRLFERGFAFFDLPTEAKNRWHPTGEPHHSRRVFVWTMTIRSILKNWRL